MIVEVVNEIEILIFSLKSTLHKILFVRLTDNCITFKAAPWDSICFLRWSEKVEKTHQGISEPIKASLKFDTAGIGHDIAKEFTNNWWDLAYKKASNAIQIEENQVHI